MQYKEKITLSKRVFCTKIYLERKYTVSSNTNIQKVRANAMSDNIQEDENKGAVFAYTA